MKLSDCMGQEYVREADGVYRVAGTRVSLDSLVYLYREGVSAEGMVESYPALTLEQVHGALAFYLANQARIDAYVQRGEAASKADHELSREKNAELITKLRRTRRETPIPG